MNNDIYEMPLFKGGNKDAIEKIMHDFPSRYVQYKKGDTIAMQGSACRSLYILCEGSVYAKMISEEGKELTLDTLSAPDVLASSFIFSSEGIFPVTILANSNCGLWIVNKESILRIIEEDSLLLRNYLKVISDHSMFLSKRVERVCLADTLVKNYKLYTAKRCHTESSRGSIYSWRSPSLPVESHIAAGQSRPASKRKQRIYAHQRLRRNKTAVADYGGLETLGAGNTWEGGKDFLSAEYTGNVGY